MIMFYQTTVKSVTAGGVIDVQGKSLSLIGNKLVRVGDLIWTDGNVVFGHTPIRGGGILHAEPSGIPVLADDLRGYFNLSGDYKPYNIKGDTWIVNDKKIYAHDNNAAEIIDAEIADDGKILTVEKITQGDGELNAGVFDKFYSREGMVFVAWGSGSIYDSGGVYSGDALKDSDFCSDDGVISRNCTLIIKANGEPIQTIDVYREHIKPYEEAEDKRIAKHLQDGLLSYSVSDKWVTETNVEPLEWHYGTRARIDDFRISSNGSWHMLLSIVVVSRQKFYTDHFKVEYPVYYTGIFLKNRSSSGGVTSLYDSVTTVVDKEPLSAHFSGSRLTVASARTVSNSFRSYFQKDFYAVINLAEEPPANIWWKWMLDKIYTANNELVCDFSNIDNIENVDAHKWNMSITELKGGQYLIGIRKDKEREVDGALFKIATDGNIEQVGYGLKNFRLRELKRISKAKK